MFYNADTMGVDHGGTGGTSPPEFGAGNANANSPLQILSYRYKNERSVNMWPSKYAKIRFLPGLCPGPRCGSSRRSPDPLVGWRGDTRPHIPLHSARTYLWRSPCVPPEVQPDLRLHSCGYDVSVNCKALVVVCSQRITKSLLLCLFLLFLMLIH